MQNNALSIAKKCQKILGNENNVMLMH